MRELQGPAWSLQEYPRPLPCIFSFHLKGWETKFLDPLYMVAYRKSDHQWSHTCCWLAEGEKEDKSLCETAFRSRFQYSATAHTFYWSACNGMCAVCWNLTSEFRSHTGVGNVTGLLSGVIYRFLAWLLLQACSRISPRTKQRWERNQETRCC